MTMRMKIHGIALAALTLIMPSDAEESPAIQTSISGMGSLEAGQVVNGWDKRSLNPTEPRVDHVWLQRAYMQLTVKGQLGDHAAAIISGEGMVTYSWAKQQEFWSTLKPAYYFYPNQVEGRYWLGEKEKPLLYVGAGIFPFKYNPDVRNLGEYLYRTGTYPGYIINEFDFPMNRLMGLRLSGNPLPWLNLDVMLTSEPYQLPMLDYGLSGLFTCSAGKALDIGAGVFFSHLFSINEEYTTPKTSDNLIQDTANPSDTSYYTFRGTKLMARFSFDPKAFFATSLFGKNDLRLYGEVAVIGLKDYAVYYDTLWQRIPVMIGFNVPAFKVLDVVAVEVEWYGNRYPNSYANVWARNNIPQPYQEPATIGIIDYKKDDWKWSVYASKKLSVFTLVGQVANDHIRMVRHDDRESDREEALRTSKDWEWMLKCAFGF